MHCEPSVQIIGGGSSLAAYRSLRLCSHRKAESSITLHCANVHAAIIPWATATGELVSVAGKTQCAAPGLVKLMNSKNQGLNCQKISGGLTSAYSLSLSLHTGNSASLTTAGG
jgi:hypothetical protein